MHLHSESPGGPEEPVFTQPENHRYFLEGAEQQRRINSILPSAPTTAGSLK